MRHILFALLFAFTLTIGTADARADGVAFPPNPCTPDSPFMSFNGLNNPNPSGKPDTYCSNGQFVLKNALPVCGSGTVVAYNGTDFYCKTDISVPACTTSQYVVVRDGALTCENKPALPTSCDPGYALAYTNGSFSCVRVGQDVPNCNGTNQFLVYGGGTFSCANVIQPAQIHIPTCGANQVVTANGSTLSCVAQAGGAADLSCTYHDYGACGVAMNAMDFGGTALGAACNAQHSVKTAPNGTSNLWFQDLPSGGNKTCLAGVWATMGGSSGSGGNGGPGAGAEAGDASGGGTTGAAAGDGG